jgi:xylulokinase
MNSWLGLDIGTSSLKALLVADDSTVLARASVPYAGQASPAGPTGEQDPQSWIAAARHAVAECVAAGGLPDGIGLAGQVPTLVTVDADGRPVRPALTWQDSRAVTEAEELERALGPSSPYIGMDLPWSASHLPAKLLWLARNEPETRARTRHLLQPKDHLGLVLTGSPLTDAWSSKGLVDIRSGRPAGAVLEASGWGPESCPPAAPPWSSRGVTTDGALGLPAGIPVSVGWSDALASMLAVGAFAKPTAFVLTGTSDIVGLSVEGAGTDPAGLYRVPLECAPRAVLYGPTQSSGATVQWLSKLFDRPIDELPAIATRAGSQTGPAFVPYIAGERAPLWQPDVRAVFADVGAEDGAPEFIRSVLRGVASSASHILDIASTEAGTRIREVHIAGRGNADMAWKQLRLETLGVPVLFHTEPYTSALGAAMLGACASTGGEADSADHLRGEPVRAEPSGDDVTLSARLSDRYLRASRLAQSWRT